MISMIERVARELCQQDEQNGAGPWDYHTTEHQDTYRELARAAIEAMREPTEKMLKACPIVQTGIDANGKWGVTTKPAQIMWPAMIDAALSE